MNSTYERIYACVSQIPKGYVMSYGGVARTIGQPRGARLVGWALRALPPDTTVPWQRVVNRQGALSIVHPIHGSEEQAQRLEAEGLSIDRSRGAEVVNPPWWQPELP